MTQYNYFDDVKVLFYLENAFNLDRAKCIGTQYKMVTGGEEESKEEKSELYKKYSKCLIMTQQEIEDLRNKENESSEEN